MTLEELKFEIAILEDRKRRASFPQVVMVWTYVGAALIVCLLVAVLFPDDTAPEWLLLLLAPAALGLWFGVGKLVDHYSPRSDWTYQDRDRLHELKGALLFREMNQ